MKWILGFFILIGITLYANDIELEATIFNKILIALSAKEHPKVFIYKNIESIERYPQNLILTSTCKDADIVVVSTLKNLPASCSKKLLLGTQYFQLRDKRVVGAFFWQKGRPNILFYKERLLNFRT